MGPNIKNLVLIGSRTNLISFYWVPAQVKICFKIRNLFSVGKMPNLKPRFNWVKDQSNNSSRQVPAQFKI